MATAKAPEIRMYSKEYVEENLKIYVQNISSWPEWKVESLRDHESQQKMIREPLTLRGK